MIRLLTLAALVLAVAFAPAFGQDKPGEKESKSIQVTAEVVGQTFTGDIADPEIDDRLIISVDIFDKNDEKVGIGAGVCTVVIVPEDPEAGDTILQCLNAGDFEEGQIIFGGLAPFPEPGVEATFAILGGTGKYREAHGEATLVVVSPTLQDATFDLE